MILIQDLTKNYLSKNKKTCVALNKINLTLPDTGMIFIIGKSGSGKSTLLNMIGGLDSFNSGKIIAGGNDLSKFKHRDAYKYRASYVGFIFQDYHLIEELTVAQNINLEAEIANAKNVNIEAALCAVDLEGYGNRFPDELSGGQKQRVAIARALIKSPRVILCDEPTGNLDKSTSTQIMDLLSEISKERLVIIVSHNMPDAEKYGDRIIELSDGNIIRDITRKDGYNNCLSIENGIISLPYNHNLTPSEAAKITSEIKQGNVVELIQNDGGYENTKEPMQRKEKGALKASKLKRKTTNSLFYAFSRASKLRTATTSFISAVMVVLLIIFQSFLMFDGSQAIAQSMGDGKGSTVVLRKNLITDDYGNTDSTKIYKITSDDISAINSSCTEEIKKYYLYNHCISIDVTDSIESDKLESKILPSLKFGTQHIYTKTMLGTLACDEEYLINKFGEDGKLKVLAGDPYQTLTDGTIIITDYLADAMRIYNPHLYKTYEDILGPLYEGKYIWANISAVIDTGYKEKYSDVIKTVANNAIKQEEGISMLDEETAIGFIDDVQTNLAIAYTMNRDFISAVSDYQYKNYNEIPGTVTIGDTSFSPQYIWMVTSDYHDIKLNDGEVLLSQRLFSQMFPELSNEEFTFPVDMTLTWHEWDNGEGELLFSKTYTIIGFSPAHQSIISENDLKEIKMVGIIPYAVYIENHSQINETIDIMAERGFSWSSVEGQAVTLLNKSVNMFFDLFRLIEIMMLVMTVIFLVSHSIRSVKNNYYQIGVIKAIGGRSVDIGKIFIMQNIMLSAIISVLTYIGSIIFIDVANDILIKSFIEITDARVGNIDIISFNPALVLAAIAATMILGLLSTAAPLILLHNIKPINIIKAKE